VSGARARAAVLSALLLVLFLVFLRASPFAIRPPAPEVSGAIEVRFTRPNLAGPQTLRGGPEAALVEAIDGAERSVDMAIYDLDLASVRQALLRAWRRDVNVRLVVESDNLDNPEMHALIAAGIPVVADGRDPLMHDKFTVIDGDEVWTGSMNYTVNDAYYNDNNLIRLLSAAAAQAYAARHGIAASAPATASPITSGRCDLFIVGSLSAFYTNRPTIAPSAAFDTHDQVP